MTLDALLDRFAAVPRSQRLGLFGLGAVLILVGFWFLMWSPGADELDALQTDITNLTVKRDEVKRRAENREQFEKELQDLTNALKQALRELPNEREIPDLLKRISAIGKKAGLEVRKFQPLPEVSKEYYAEVPVSVEVYGSYHETAMFFDRLSKLSRIVYVRDVTMAKPEDRGGKVYLTVTGTLVTFRFLSEEEIKRKAEADKAKKEKGGGE